MRNLKLLLLMFIVLVVTTSCTDNTEELITNTQNTEVTDTQGFTNYTSDYYFTGEGEDKGGSGKE